MQFTDTTRRSSLAMYLPADGSPVAAANSGASRGAAGHGQAGPPAPRRSRRRRRRKVSRRSAAGSVRARSHRSERQYSLARMQARARSSLLVQRPNTTVSGTASTPAARNAPCVPRSRPSQQAVAMKYVDACTRAVFGGHVLWFHVPPHQHAAANRAGSYRPGEQHPAADLCLGDRAAGQQPERQVVPACCDHPVRSASHASTRMTRSYRSGSAARARAA